MKWRIVISLGLIKACDLKYSDYEGLDSCDSKITEMNSLFKIFLNEMDL